MIAAPSAGPTLVVAACRPRPGDQADLLQPPRECVPVLRERGLATDQAVTACQSQDGKTVEIFEWAPGGIERAHTRPPCSRSGATTPPPATRSLRHVA
jgi:hypothetical protein